MINIPDKPFAATWEEWDDWHDNASKKYPVRYFLTHTLRYAVARTWHRFIHQPWYWLKCKVWHRYNVVVCRKLGPTWVDRDLLMFHAVFQCLVDFVEKEDPQMARQTHEDVYGRYRESGPEYAKKCADDYMAIKELYWWYKYHDPYRVDGGLTEKLHQLIDLRGYLWT